MTVPGSTTAVIFSTRAPSPLSVSASTSALSGTAVDPALVGDTLPGVDGIEGSGLLHLCAHMPGGFARLRQLSVRWKPCFGHRLLSTFRSPGARPPPDM